MKQLRNSTACLVLGSVMLQACALQAHQYRADSPPTRPAIQPGQQVSPTSTFAIPTPAGDPYSEVPGEDREVASSVRVCVGEEAVIHQLLVRRASRGTIDAMTGAVRGGSLYDATEVLWVVAYLAGGLAVDQVTGPFGNPAADEATVVAQSTPLPDKNLDPTLIAPSPSELRGAKGLGLTMGICYFVASTGDWTGHSVFPPEEAEAMFAKVRSLPSVSSP